MSRHGTVLALALAACLVGPSLAVGQSSTTLILTILEPDGPITDSDVMRIRALTPELVFRDTGFNITSSFLITGPRIDWTIISEHEEGDVYNICLPMGHIGELGPLPAGTCHIYANWNHTGGGLLSDAPSSGTGYTSFTVVPEPSTLAMGLAGAIAVVCVARQRRRLGHAPF